MIKYGLACVLLLVVCMNAQAQDRMPPIPAEKMSDMIGLSGWYTLVSMVLNTVRTPLQEGATPMLAPLPR